MTERKIAEFIRQQSKARNVTDEALGKVIGCTGANVSYMLSGRHHARIDYLNMMLTELGYELSISPLSEKTGTGYVRDKLSVIIECAGSDRVRIAAEDALRAIMNMEADDGRKESENTATSA